MYQILGRPYAVACISGETGSKTTGIVRFYRRQGDTLVIAQLRGLPESQSGFYGFHIHEGMDCAGLGFSETGGHFDPCDTTHPMHAGDLPPLLGCHGRAFLAVETDRFCPEEVVGRTVVIHSRPDDFHTQPAGDSGSKIACGVIRKV